MAKTKRSYTPEFRADAVRLIFEQGRSVADVARNLDGKRSAIPMFRASVS